MELITAAPIERITLSQVLPGPIEAGGVRGSQVWLSEIAFERGGRYGVEASSGTGKSTLCNLIYGLRRDFAGRLAFDGVDSRLLTPAAWSRLRSRHLAYLPQDLRLFPDLSVGDNIEVKNRLTDHVTPERIREMLGRLGLADRLTTPAGRLSVGQQQRVAAVRALCQPFHFILLDEPVSHLDAANNRALAALIAEEASAQGAAIIATSVGNPLLLDGDVTILSL